MPNHKYEILKHLPVYGPMWVSIGSRRQLGEGYVVRFFRDDGSDWVANFECDGTPLSLVTEYPGSDWLLVIAGGQDYVMDSNKEQSISSITNGSISHFFVWEDHFIFILMVDIMMYNYKTGEKWFSKRISLDGFENVQLQGDIITGFADEPYSEQMCSVPFSLNLKTKEIIGGWG